MIGMSKIKLDALVNIIDTCPIVTGRTSECEDLAILILRLLGHTTRVSILTSTDGHAGKTGHVVEMFKSGNVLVRVDAHNFLNIPSGSVRAIPD